MDRKIIPRMTGLGFLLGMVVAVPVDVARDSSYAGRCGDLSKCGSYSDSLAAGGLKVCSTGENHYKENGGDFHMNLHKDKCADSLNCTYHLEGLAVDTMPKYFPKDTSKNICLPGDKTCD